MGLGRSDMKVAVILAAILALGFTSAGPVQAHSHPGPMIGSMSSAAQSSNPFSALVGKRRVRHNDRSGRTAIERYVLASDDRTFLFEQWQNEARIKFLCSPNDQRIDCLLDETGPAPEIYQLRQTRGPRGDLIYKNAHGDTLLRIASYGGATVFWPGEQRGLAASKSFGDNKALKLPPAGIETATRRARAATATISALTGAPIIFDLGVTPPEAADATVLADAVIRSAKGIKDVAGDPTGARVVASRIRRVVFIVGAAANVSLNDAVLEIHYVPNLDIAGRPSSAAISHYLEDAL